MEPPISSLYDDVYFSKEGGWEETRYVFLQGNNLVTRWQNLNQRNFVIAETGFGTGLNFLTTWKLWKDSGLGDSDRWLHFISVEAHPLGRDAIQKYLSHITELSSELQEFLGQYQLHSEGFYRFHFPGSRVSLMILYGDVKTVLADLDAEVDAWYLDGFSPAKNPEMWSPIVFQEIGRLSRKNTTFATYTSAGFVRKGLQEVGFHVRKVPGFGKKRDMSLGVFQSAESRSPSNHSGNIRIVGAGIAGASVAYALALRGIASHVYDRKGVAMSASGNPAGIFYPYLTKFPIPPSRFSLQSYYYALQCLLEPSSVGNPEQEKFPGTLGAQSLEFRLDSEAKLDRYQSSLRNFALPTHVAAIAPDKKSIHFPQGRTLYPKKLVEALMDSPLIEFHRESLEESVMDANDSVRVYCNSYEANVYLQTISPGYPILKKVRGQLGYFKNADFAEQTQIPICCDSYISPINGDLYVAGSTYDEFYPDDPWRESDERKIIQDIAKLIPLKRNPDEWDDWIELRNKERTGDGWEGSNYRVSHRAQSKDRVPIIGELGGSYLFTGLGSRGLVYGLLGGELIASLILGEPNPIPRSVYKGISPQRFL